MTTLNYPKAASRDAGRGVPRYRSDADWKPSITEEEVRRIRLGPEAIRCRRCPDHFLTTGEEERPRPIHLCPRCRLDVEEECELNGLPTILLDDTLTEALETIAKLEGRLVQAQRQGSLRRAERLRDRVGRVRAELWERAAKYSAREVAA